MPLLTLLRVPPRWLHRSPGAATVSQTTPHEFQGKPVEMARSRTPRGWSPGESLWPHHVVKSDRAEARRVVLGFDRATLLCRSDSAVLRAASPLRQPDCDGIRIAGKTYPLVTNNGDNPSRGTKGFASALERRDKDTPRAPPHLHAPSPDVRRPIRTSPPGYLHLTDKTALVDYHATTAADGLQNDAAQLLQTGGKVGASSAPVMLNNADRYTPVDATLSRRVVGPVPARPFDFRQRPLSIAHHPSWQLKTSRATITLGATGKGPAPNWPRMTIRRRPHARAPYHEPGVQFYPVNSVRHVSGEGRHVYAVRTACAWRPTLSRFPQSEAFPSRKCAVTY